MTDWARVRADDFAVPADRPLPELVAELSELLRSPDPLVRDGQAYAVLATWIGRDVLSADELVALGDQMVERFGDAEIQARTFAPLILDCIVSAGAYEARWVPPFERWYVGETDLRGQDADLGWLHAVAHGADLLGTFGLHPAVEPVEMLRLGIGRLLTPTTYVLRDMEDDRLSYALALTLTRPELTEVDAIGWLDPAYAGLVLPTEVISPLTTNTLRTLRALYLLVDRGVRLPNGKVAQAPYREQVKTKLADVVAVVNRTYF
ncbi:DUF2785 domain-containing protein [Kribbella sandramycini]|uniref:DUF2785 domain-containing protein n=1 Tax=Kribbella sandramycini TaxID=60450 RepID=A0A7Y4P3I4_9ACTN|nr:DUF2785 domain-containing protein [Kribbella sandramycini]MBB6566093.1 hypothetical protein [Kribbella sandramycini]NOL45093.1 DUF2785 domain-containing protein [Kribbella sandramycini]